MAQSGRSRSRTGRSGGALRFAEVPETEVSFRGRPAISSRSHSERRNLPDEVEAGVTYGEIEVRWSAGARFQARKR